MLTLYLSCLVVGGVFVGLSALGAVGKDVDADVDADADADADADVDAGHLEVGHALTLADASHGVVAKHRPKRPWLPILSFRFWTFGSAFFGLTGTLLTTLTGAGVLFIALTSAGTGVGVGTLSAWLVRFLRKPVGATVRLGDYSGSVGVTMLPLREGGVTRIKVQVRERERSLLAVSPEPRALPAGTRVLVLGIDEDGRAQIEPEQSLFSKEE